MKYFTFMLLISTSLVAFERHYFCNFPKYSNDTGIQKANDFKFSFKINTETGESSMTDNSAGLFRTQLLYDHDNDITNLIMLRGKSLMTLTVLSNGTAVHSRHDVFVYNGSHLTPSQYYGTCETSE